MNEAWKTMMNQRVCNMFGRSFRLGTVILMWLGDIVIAAIIFFFLGMYFGGK